MKDSLFQPLCDECNNHNRRKLFQGNAAFSEGFQTGHTFLDVDNIFGKGNFEDSFNTFPQQISGSCQF